LAEPRPSLSPSTFPDGKFDEFVQADADARDEDTVKDSVIPKMMDAIGETNHPKRNILFNNLAPLIDDELKMAKPDFYYGAPPEQLNRGVRDKLSGDIIPSTQDNLPIAPNLFLEAKGPDGSLAVAARQACYDGALGARAMHSLQSYGQGEPAYDNNAYTISSIYHGGTLKMYSHYPAQPNGPGTRPEYYMHSLNGWHMTGNKITHVQGLTALKNAKGWTKEVRDAAIARANERARETVEDEEAEETEVEEAQETDDEEVQAWSSSTMPSFAYRTTELTLSTLTEDERHDLYESETSIDELAVDDKFHPPPAKRSSKSHQYRRQKRRTF